MADRRPLRVGLHAVLWCGLVPALSGCALLNGFLDPTQVGQFKPAFSQTSIVGVLTPLDGPATLPNASEPHPDDLVPVLEDYRIVPGDPIVILIDNLLGDAPYQAQQSVSFTGYIRVPELGSVKVVGMTEAEVERELVDQLKTKGILPFPNVQVFLQERRGSYFSITGNVLQQGPYAITQPDMRLLDAIAMARGIGPDVKKLYIIRRVEPGTTTTFPMERGRPDENGLIVPPPMEDEDPPPVTPATFYSSAGTARRMQETPPEREPPVEDQIVPEDLEDLLGMPRKKPATSPTSEERSPERIPPMIFDPTTGKIVEERPPVTEEPLEMDKPAPAAPLPDEAKPFDWDDFPDVEASQRVIEIDATALLQGDPKQNVIIRSRDVIHVPTDTGVFYIMGEVNRPGVYAFGGRDITLKQAIATAGNFAPLAWPQRCEIIRRQPGADSQITIPVNLDAIFAGLEPDIFLRDEDILNVGTHIVSPFLYVIRNSFRFTYGFGFVYDRNFADKDAYFGRENPESLAERRRQSRGLPF